MAPKIIIYAGAPTVDSLDWSPAGLLNEFIIDISGAKSATAIASISTPSLASTARSNYDYPVWRSLPLTKTHIPTGFSQQHAAHLYDQYHGHDNFFNVVAASQDSLASISQDEMPTIGTQDVLSQFYEHSMAHHEDVRSSQLVLGSQEDANEDTTSFLTNADTTSFLSEYDDTSTASVKLPLPAHHGASPLSNLDDIPTARYITSVEPQTITANLIVGIISIAAPRSVQTRWGQAKSLVEVLVGDETRSGFAITFWLPSHEIDTSVLAGLRPQDIVLVQYVALNVFMGKVYGGSLRKNTTKVHLLYRRTLDNTDVPGHYLAADLASSKPCHPQLDKTRRVREWVLKFVGGPSKRKEDIVGTKRAWGIRPPVDTQ